MLYLGTLLISFRYYTGKWEGNQRKGQEEVENWRKDGRAGKSEKGQKGEALPFITPKEKELTIVPCLYNGPAPLPTCSKLGAISESTKSFLKNKFVRINGHQSWLANFFVMARKAVNFNPTHHARHMRRNHPERSNTNNGNTVTWRQLVRLTWHPTINSLNVRLYALHKPILHFPSRRRALWRQRCHVAAHDASNVVASYIGWTSV